MVKVSSPRLIRKEVVSGMFLFCVQHNCPCLVVLRLSPTPCPPVRSPHEHKRPWLWWQRVPASSDPARVSRLPLQPRRLLGFLQSLCTVGQCTFIPGNVQLIPVHPSNSDQTLLLNNTFFWSSETNEGHFGALFCRFLFLSFRIFSLLAYMCLSVVNGPCMLL